MAKLPRGNSAEFDRLKKAAQDIHLFGAEQRQDIPLIPEAAKIETRDSWQIVVVGAIDPRQHYPKWYGQIKCVNETELAFAAQHSSGIFPAPMPGIAQQSFSRFDAGTFSIEVVQDKWTIQTVNESNLTRLIDVADVVFKKLYEIPITAFGVNKIWRVKLNKMTAKGFLSKKILSADFGTPVDSSTGEVSILQNLNDSDINIHLAASPLNEKWMTVLYNHHHPMRGQVGYFDLGDILKQGASADWRGASNYAGNLVECVQQAEGV